MQAYQLVLMQETLLLEQLKLKYYNMPVDISDKVIAGTQVICCFSVKK